MFKFLNVEPESFGLDFSDLSLKIVKLKKRGRFLSLASWEEIPIKPGLIEEGEIKDEKTLIEIIKAGLNKVKGEKMKCKNVVASLPEKKAFFQIIQMPKMEKKELETAVPFEAENYIPLSINDVYLDFQVISGSSDRLNILIAAIPREVVDSYLSCLKKSGLIVQALEVESKSITRALIKNKISSSPILIIDFGGSITSFIFFSGYSLRFTSSISISSQGITEAIARALKIDLIKAEELKIKYGLKMKKDSRLKKTKNNSKLAEEAMENKEILEPIKPILINLAEQARKHIKYYQNHINYTEHLSKDGKIEKIVLCGRGSNLKGLTDFLSFELKVPVELGNPWINILSDPLREVPGMPYEESLGYTTALGLALRGIGK